MMNETLLRMNQGDSTPHPHPHPINHSNSHTTTIPTAKFKKKVRMFKRIWLFSKSSYVFRV